MKKLRHLANRLWRREPGNNIERKRAEQALAASQRELEIHNRIAAVFLTAEDEEIYEKVLEVVLQAFDSRGGVFGYIDDGGNLVCPSMTPEISEQCRMDDKTIVLPPTAWAGIWGKALSTKRSVLSNEPNQVPVGHVAVRRCVFVPIVDKGKLIGLLAVANRETDYTEVDRSQLETIAGHIGPILHARLARDMEERVRLRAEDDLRRALADKNELLKEVHHRVKNNMAVISSMISLQSENLVYEETVHSLNKIRNRIRAMALVHDQMYHSEDFRRVDLGEYARRLTDSLLQTHADRAGRVELQTRIADVAMNIDVAIPCAMILNELVTNSLEHAFQDGRRGEIVVALDRLEDERFELAVTDNGVGFNDDNGVRGANRMGLELVALLAKQLGGELEMRENHGADVRVRFVFE